MSFRTKRSLLRDVKLVTLKAVEAVRLDEWVLASAWRRERLLILCYHGISLEDEHLWDSQLYMPRELLRARFQMLRDFRANVLGLNEALERLFAGTLPPRSIVLTFDDGNYDFYRIAAPTLKEFGLPATLYLTTYYSEYNRPVFDVAASYLLWKARGRRLSWPEIFGPEFEITDSTRTFAWQAVLDSAKRDQLSALQKDGLLRELCVRTGIDYDAFCAKRLFHLMTPHEVAEIAAGGVDIQLHTHRHRTSVNRDLFLREIDENRAKIEQSTLRGANHFCYPGGFHLPEFQEWLRARDIASATTCKPDLASRDMNRMLLPRVVDHTELTDAEFRAWFTGVAAWLPRRSHVMGKGQLLEG